MPETLIDTWKGTSPAVWERIQSLRSIPAANTAFRKSKSKWRLLPAADTWISPQSAMYVLSSSQAYVSRKIRCFLKLHVVTNSVYIASVGHHRLLSFTAWHSKIDYVSASQNHSRWNQCQHLQTNNIYQHMSEGISTDSASCGSYEPVSWHCSSHGTLSSMQGLIKHQGAQIMSKRLAVIYRFIAHLGQTAKKAAALQLVMSHTLWFRYQCYIAKRILAATL